jgi:hypothetical protein
MWHETHNSYCVWKHKKTQNGGDGGGGGGAIVLRSVIVAVCQGVAMMAAHIVADQRPTTETPASIRYYKLAVWLHYRKTCIDFVYRLLKVQTFQHMHLIWEG